jgi:hypothetical protein
VKGKYRHEESQHDGGRCPEGTGATRIFRTTSHYDREAKHDQNQNQKHTADQFDLRGLDVYDIVFVGFHSGHVQGLCSENWVVFQSERCFGLGSGLIHAL